MADDIHSVPSGGSIYAGAPAPQPLWMSGMAAWECKQLANTNINDTLPTVTTGLGDPVTRISAWNAIVVWFWKVYQALGGGHADWAGNDVECNDLELDVPTQWALMREPTPAADLLADTDEYADGNPTARHIYYAVFVDLLRHMLFFFGIGSGHGNGGHTTTTRHGFNLLTNEFDPAGTWSSVPGTLARGQAMCQDPRTGDVWICGDVNIIKWTRATNTFTVLAAFPQNGSATYYRASAVDTLRERVVILGDAYNTDTGILIYDIAGNSFSSDELTGSYAATVAAASGNAADYWADEDYFVVKTNSGHTHIIVDAATFATSLAPVTGDVPPNAANGVFGLWRRLDKGWIYKPSGNNDLFYIKGP
jgi:hypothetical protein